MKPQRELIEQLKLEKIQAAQEMSVEQKLGRGGELFELACEAMRTGIRAQNPELSGEQIEELLTERLRAARERERRRESK